MFKWSELQQQECTSAQVPELQEGILRVLRAEGQVPRMWQDILALKGAPRPRGKHTKKTRRQS